MVSAILFVFFVAVAYLSGSVCSAVIVSRVFDLPDPRTEGSQNPGATNVLRLAGKKYASIVLVADMLKGFIPVFFAQLLGAGPNTVAFACFAAVMGHMFPVFFDFKGGKGVATAIGALLGFHLMLGIAVAATWLLIANFFRYSSVASIMSLIIMPFYAIIITHNPALLTPLCLMMLFVLYQHRDNYTRLMDGTESKIKLHHHDISDISDQLFETTKEKTPNKAAKSNKTAEKSADKTTTAAAKKAPPSKTSKTPTKTTKKPAVKTTKTTKTTKKKPSH